ncbi:MAG: FG-GAP-like repeat-containing protein [Verrucomicrobiota bacterium]
MNRGVSLMAQYLYTDASQAFETALQADPELVEARINLAIALFNRNKKDDVEEAEKQLAVVLQKDPENLRALYFKAIVLQHKGDAEAAVPCLLKVVQAHPEDGAAWYVLAVCKQRANQPAEAEFLKAVQHRPYLFSAYYQLYQTAMRAGETAKGTAYLEQFKALRESPLGESIELPQYNQMGDLALARPLPTDAPPVTRSRFQFKEAQILLRTGDSLPQKASASAAASLGGLAAADLNQDGELDLVIPLGSDRGVVLLRQDGPGRFSEATAGSGLDAIAGAGTCAIGDVDNDNYPDVFLSSDSGGVLLRGKGDGTFQDVTLQAGLAFARQKLASALFLDADHDGDLDLFVCDSAGGQLWNNNGDGTFTNITAKAALPIDASNIVLALAGDLDGDRDQDLVLLRRGAPGVILFNELLGHYRRADLDGVSVQGDLGGALQDFNGDGLLDLLVLGGTPAALRLWLGDGQGRFKADSAFNEVADAIASRGVVSGFRIGDIDLDGDIDVIVAGKAVHFLLNSGRGRFVGQASVWQPAPGATLTGIEVIDGNGDFVPDVLAILEGGAARVLFLPGELSPPSTALALQPTGVRSRDGRTRSPASGFGASITARVGLHEQRIVYSGQAGGMNQSAAPLVLGLSGAGKVDYVHLTWPDAVAQAEMSLTAGQVHKVAELQRKISSCPVLFAWNGSRFDFVTDFAGVGGLGYLAAPGSYAAPQVREHVRLGPGQLKPAEGYYGLRVTEPMEETAYIDQLELWAIDHPATQQVYPDERLAISGPAPSHQWLIVAKPIFPTRATGPSGRDCLDRLRQVDRLYAYEPKLDRRYIGFCEPHTLELEFSAGLDVISSSEVWLFINGSIEYPYSQTVYAASQSRIGWEPIRVECQDANGHWRTMVADAGAPGGMARTMTIDLSTSWTPAIRKLRLTTNLEILYDQIFLAGTSRPSGSTTKQVPLKDAVLRPLGYPREYSPDGRLPLIYDYEVREASAPFHTLKGAYTRYGEVSELLTAFDDRYALVGPGDEIALRFDAQALPPIAPGNARTFILVSHAYCKDMDLYTASPQTLEPLPFRGMSGYPYPATEHYPTTAFHQEFLRTYNTRIVR